MGASPRSSSHTEPASGVAAAASLILIVVSTIVLAGWAFDVDALKGLSGSITMKANAAIGLLASGLALLLVRFDSRWASVPGRLFALLAGSLGLLTLLEHVVGWNFGIDELLFHEPAGAAATISPGRMGPTASASLACAGIALWSLYRQDLKAIVRAQMLGAFVAVLAVVPTVGYLYGATQLYAIARYTGIGFHTGLSLLVLSLGILAARPDSGPVAALMSNAPHAVMARRLLVPAMVLPLLLGYIRLIGERRGLYDTGFGASIFAVAMMVLLSLTIWRIAVELGRSEQARRSAEAALTETEQRFRQLADQAPVLIWVEEAGERVWFNKGWYDFTGASRTDIDWRNLVHPDDLAAYTTESRQVARAGGSYSYQYRLRRADGRYAWVLETASPRVGRTGLSGYVGSCIDVTELRQAQQDRDDLLVKERAARERAERADRTKDEFIAALSHELRTPLNAILGWMQMLQRGIVTDAGRAKATEAVNRNAGVLSRLIEDLLDTSRITTGHLELSLKPVDMNAVVHAAVESVTPSAEAKGMTVAVSAASAVPMVDGDAQRLQQVVWNLLSNAIKFSPSGGRVGVMVSADGEHVVVSVSDEGAGIDSSLLPHIFERFRQGDSESARGAAGLGLGLYIARHLIELHGGTIDAQSAGAGHGAVFAIRLPALAQTSAVTDAALSVPDESVSVARG